MQKIDMQKIESVTGDWYANIFWDGVMEGAYLYLFPILFLAMVDMMLDRKGVYLAVPKFASKVIIRLFKLKKKNKEENVDFL